MRSRCSTIRALTELVVVGLPTGQPFHLRVMDDPEFLRGEVDITYLERAGARVLAAPPRPGLERALAVTAALVTDEQRERTGGRDRQEGRDGRDGPSPWVSEGRRMNLRGGLE
jgi:acetyl/propionyl-CoA carboxylase alpha subunit